MPIKSSLFGKSWNRVMNGHPQYTQTLLTLSKPLIVLTAQHLRESSVQSLSDPRQACVHHQNVLHSDYSARVICGKDLTEDFAIRTTGKTRLCALSPSLFSLYRLTYEESNRERQKRNSMDPNGHLRLCGCVACSSSSRHPVLRKLTMWPQ